MNKNFYLSSIVVAGLLSVSLISPSFAQNTVLPTDPAEKAVDNTKPKASTVKPTKKHKHHKKGMKGMKKIHKKSDVKPEAKSAEIPAQVNGVHD